MRGHATPDSFNWSNGRAGGQRASPRFRHYGLLASGTRAGNIARARQLLDISMAKPGTADTTTSGETSEPKPLSHPCPGEKEAVALKRPHPPDIRVRLNPGRVFCVLVVPFDRIFPGGIST